MTRRVYQRLADLATTVLRAGTSVVVDAACTRRWQRELIAAAAAETRTPLVWLQCDVPVEEAIRRVAARRDGGGDASDASVEVVRRQSAARELLTADELGVGRSVVRFTTADIAAGDLASRLAAISAEAAGVPAAGRPL